MFTKKGWMIFLAVLLLWVSAAVADSAKYTLSDTIRYEKGMSTISWTVEGSAEKVKVVACLDTGNESVKQKAFLVGETSGRSIKTEYLAPGQSYTIFLLDADFNMLAVKVCKVPDVPVFADGLLKDTSVKVTLEKREYPLDTQKPKKVSQLSAKAIAEDLTNGKKYYGVKYHMQMPKLAKPRTFFVTLVFEAPNGFMTVERAKDLTFDRVDGGYQTLWWEIAGPEFFYDLYNANESIPTGTYKIHLYWDGMKVNTSTFDVGA